MATFTIFATILLATFAISLGVPLEEQVPVTNVEPQKEVKEDAAQQYPGAIAQDLNLSEQSVPVAPVDVPAGAQQGDAPAAPETNAPEGTDLETANTLWGGYGGYGGWGGYNPYYGRYYGGWRRGWGGGWGGGYGGYGGWSGRGYGGWGGWGGGYGGYRRGGWGGYWG